MFMVTSHHDSLTDGSSSDFPGGDGEKFFEGRATVDDVDPAARSMFGLQPFTIPPGGSEGSLETIKKANTVLFG